MQNQLQRSILITGCSSGMGLAVALALQTRGWQVFATARKTADIMRLQQLGLQNVLHMDMQDSATIQSTLAHILQLTGGRLDALFNNAGYGQPGAVEDLPRAALREQFETNVFGALELSNLVLPVMRKQGAGRIIFNSSVLGFAAMPMRGAYNASKFALEGLVDTLRLELHGSGIHACLLQPGPVLTRFRENSYPYFVKYIQPAMSVHQTRYVDLAARLQKEGAAAPFTLPAEAAIKPLIHALEARNPRIRYRLTLATHLFYWSKLLLPMRCFEGFTRWFLKY